MPTHPFFVIFMLCFVSKTLSFISSLCCYKEKVYLCHRNAKPAINRK